jgi:hypothetical protein
MSISTSAALAELLLIRTVAAAAGRAIFLYCYANCLSTGKNKGAQTPVIQFQ